MKQQFKGAPRTDAGLDEQRSLPGRCGVAARFSLLIAERSHQIMVAPRVFQLTETKVACNGDVGPLLTSCRESQAL